ncbi:hypothetical protein FHX57_006436 [Paraburkholderia tropica]|uniref:hypothetical protein n=1 Tax=Paraburkholderia tropica TaxID=92647 RepID=UPI00161D6902|nr:hypothetical protein [Paraburkholderia tropica]MBB2984292.1 hypothetical protein [Paraburkholderia tropica]MBB3004057.1 hypothetical protein [Paraburkholderia tropica]MBB6323214.1 hypothetical protein [Paraburkholderia tropica]
MAAQHFFRALAELFPVAKGDVRREHQARSAAAPYAPMSVQPTQPTQTAQPRCVGEGAENETFVTIEDVPNLFVDEGDCVVQFVPAFDEGARDTPFGTKILPELAPHWSLLREHTSPLKDAIAAAIRERGAPQMSPTPSVASHVQAPSPVGQHNHTAHQEFEQPAAHAAQEPRAQRNAGGHRRDMLAAIHGKVVSWGEEKFPNRKPNGKPFYTSFAMRIQTAMGEQILQGEGLKDAIADSLCKLGDTVSVRRLEKIKVPAFREGGQPVMKDGQQVLWDKWRWSITR